MHADRYLKCVLTVIALELAWLGVRDLAPPVAAQTAATPVVITGIQLAEADGAHLPVVVIGSARQMPAALSATVERLTTALSGPIRLDTREPLTVEINGPVKVEADHPLKVDQVRYTPGAQPGD